MTNDPLSAIHQEADPYLAKCVLCNHNRCKPKSDFCAECQEDGGDLYDWNFGRCYVCRDFHDHAHCIGVPCQCPCPPPDQVQRQREQEAVLSKLTPQERSILGF